MILALLTVLFFASVSHAEDLPYVQWVACSDGDSCTVNIMTLVPLPAVFGHEVGVRLSGIDTPEMRGQCAKEKALAIVARDYLSAQVRAAKKIEIKEVFRDKYFRVEGILLADGVNMNQLMVQKGYAVLYGGTGPRHNWCAP